MERYEEEEEDGSGEMKEEEWRGMEEEEASLRECVF
jgi:hypothetical protein